MTIEERAQTVIAEIGRYSESSEIRALIEKALSDQADELEAARKQYEYHCGYLDNARQGIVDAAVAHSITSSAESKLTRMTPPDWRDEEARTISIHACHILMGAEDAARVALNAAVREYRKLMEGSCD